MNRPHVIMSTHHTDMSVCHATCESVCPSTSNLVPLSIHTTASPSVIPICPLTENVPKTLSKAPCLVAKRMSQTLHLLLFKQSM